MKVALIQMSAMRVRTVAYHGSAGVLDPDKFYGDDKARRSSKRRKAQIQALHQGASLKRNDDMFVNYRAQTWTWVRERFKATYDAIERAREGFIVNFDPDDLISLDSGCQHLTELQSELSRPKRLWSNNGKIKVESKADMKKRGVDSPNLADALVVAMSIRKPVEQKLEPLYYHEYVMSDPGVGY